MHLFRKGITTPHLWTLDAGFRKPCLLGSVQRLPHLLHALGHRKLQLLNPLARHRRNRIELQLSTRRPLLQLLELLGIGHVDFRCDHQRWLLFEARAETRQFAADHLNVIYYIRTAAAIGDIDHVHQQARALDVPQKLGAETGAGVRAFDLSRNVGDHDALFFSFIADKHHSEIRLEGGEGIISDLRAGCRDARDERRLADIRIAD